MSASPPSLLSQSLFSFQLCKGTFNNGDIIKTQMNFPMLFILKPFNFLPSICYVSANKNVVLNLPKMYTSISKPHASESTCQMHVKSCFLIFWILYGSAHNNNILFKEADIFICRRVLVVLTSYCSSLFHR